MKSIVNLQKSEPKFPKLMILAATNTIILATKYGDGYDAGRPYGVLVANPSAYPIGELSYWSEDFIDFDGSVTLSND